MNSIIQLSDCAEKHLRHYVDPNGTRAFAAYDRQGAPNTFEPVDALAPALLDAAVRGSIVIEMFGGISEPHLKLRSAIDRLLNETSETTPDFGSLDLNDSGGKWQLVREILLCSDEVKGLAASKVTKMLHRKRPTMVPIFDSKVAAFYDTKPNHPGRLWPLLQSDLNASIDLIASLATGVRTPDDRPISHLRVLDIVIWEHIVTGCHHRAD